MCIGLADRSGEAIGVAGLIGQGPARPGQDANKDDVGRRHARPHVLDQTAVPAGRFRTLPLPSFSEEWREQFKGLVITLDSVTRDLPAEVRFPSSHAHAHPCLYV